MNVMRLTATMKFMQTASEVCLLQRLLRFIVQRINPLFVSPFDFSRLLSSFERESENKLDILKLQASKSHDKHCCWEEGEGGGAVI